MTINRKAYHVLQAWKNRTDRKPMLLRGARQVGKTTLVHQFAADFSAFLSLNLERDDDRHVFESLDNIDEIVNAIFLLKKVPVGKGPTLLFIDEIQECPKAIHQLRYFQEDRPDLYVIAAGSLLEFALDEVPSFPVGRIDYLYLHPLDFEEYLTALGHESALAAYHEFPIKSYANDTLRSLFHQYAIIGGMPEVVSSFVAHGNIARMKRIYEGLWQSYKDDVEKYARNDTDRKIIRHVINTVANENDRVTFERFGNSNYRSREVGEAMRALDMARIVRLIYPTTATSPPLKPDLKKRPRLQFLDVGILNQALELQGQMLGLDDLNDFYRGKIVQQVVTQGLIAQHEESPYNPHFWVREKKDASAEVDLVFQYKQLLIPIELKSGKAGKLRSLHQFMQRCDHPYAVRLLANKLSTEELKTPDGTPYKLLNLPYYLAAKLPQDIAWFVEKKGKR